MQETNDNEQATSLQATTNYRATHITSRAKDLVCLILGRRQCSMQNYTLGHEEFKKSAKRLSMYQQT